MIFNSYSLNIIFLLECRLSTSLVGGSLLNWFTGSSESSNKAEGETSKQNEDADVYDDDEELE